jgi:hypothetical protein
MVGKKKASSEEKSCVYLSNSTLPSFYLSGKNA